jgi:hypothetical protein
MFKRILLLLICVLCVLQIAAQNNKNRKKTTTTRVSRAPKINDVLNDIAWKNAKILSNFLIFRPDNDTLVSSEYQTFVKVVYDNNALYVSAEMRDLDPKNVPQEFVVKDNFSQADFFVVTNNSNDHGQNPFEFVVQATGNQLDAKVSNGNEDFNWNAVWESVSKVTTKGWNVEIKLPH